MTDVLSPFQRYQNDLKSGTLLADPAQASVIEQLDDLHARLLARLARQNTIWSRIQRLLGRSEGPGARSLPLGRGWPR
jgi:predicted ATPase